MSTVRTNLLNEFGYTPYCGAVTCPYSWPRSKFDGHQFGCTCGWKSAFEADFIKEYKKAQARLRDEVIDSRTRPFAGTQKYLIIGNAGSTNKRPLTEMSET